MFSAERHFQSLNLWRFPRIASLSAFARIVLPVPADPGDAENPEIPGNADDTPNAPAASKVAEYVAEFSKLQKTLRRLGEMSANVAAAVPKAEQEKIDLVIEQIIKFANPDPPQISMNPNEPTLMKSEIHDCPVVIARNNFKFKSLSCWAVNAFLRCSHACRFCYLST